MSGRPLLDWAEIMPLLGDLRDVEIAARFKCHKCTIRKRRTQMGIPKASQCGAKPCSKFRLMDALPDLGKKTDQAIADRFGMTKDGVRYWRVKCGIPADPRNHYTKPYNRRFEAAGIGTRPDAEVARELGVHVSSVGHARRLRGIPVYRRPRLCVCGQVFTPYNNQIFHANECSIASQHHAEFRRVSSCDDTGEFRRLVFLINRFSKRVHSDQWRSRGNKKP